MSSDWFDFEDEIASGFFDKSKIERIKKNALGINSKKIEINGSWSRSNEVNDILDLASSKYELRNKTKLLDSLLKEKNITRNRASRLADIYADDFFSSDIDAKLSKIKTQFSSDGYEMEGQKSVDRKGKKEPKGLHTEKSPSCASANSYAFSEVNNDARSRKDSMDSSWSRKSCQPTVNFPSSSASTISDAYGGCSTKSIGRSISRDSDDSVCTEKSVNSSTISEKLADGTDKTQFESNESWLKKSTSGSKIAEKKVNDMTMTEKNEDGMCEKSTTRMSYLEKSATGSSLQEEMTSERVTSSGKGGTKTVEQKTSSETFKKMQHKSTPGKSAYYDDLESSCSYDFGPSTFSKRTTEDREKMSTLRRKDLFSSGGTSSSRVSEKLSKLIDEAVHQDDLFRIPSSLQTDIDKMTDDFFNSRSLGRDRGRTRGRRLADLFSGADKEESYTACSKLTKLKSENDSLQKENLKLQSIIRDVTAVNKRWQKYNNERRLYVQKLLSTIQDLQEQINLISEKSAFQSKSNEEVGSQLSEIERLKKEHQEHVALLELQIKSHKDDWDTERRENKKAVQEKEDMENRVRELMREVKYFKAILQEERHRKNRLCLSCKTKFNDQAEVFERMEYCPQAAPLSVSNCTNGSCRTTVHIPFKMTDIENDACYFNKEDILTDNRMTSTEPSPYFPVPRGDINENYSNERFSRISKSKKSVTSDTVVVEDESGIRLAITEQFPSKDTNLKSILKKTEKKNKSSGSKSFTMHETKEEPISSRSRMTCTGNPDITCDDCSSEDANSFEVSIGFQSGRVAQVTSFVPNISAANNSMQYLSIGAPHLLSVGEISRSRSEPTTRSNSSENLKPLRESSSWNSESFGAECSTKESVVCPDCHRIFPSSMHLKQLDHYELCQSEKNQF